MEGASPRPKGMVVLIMMALLLSGAPTIGAEEPSNEFSIDGRLQMIALSAGETYQQTVQVEDGMVVSVNVGCSSCEVQLDAGETSLTSSTTVTHRATSSGSVEITIQSTIDETVSVSFLVVIDDVNPNQRPSPQSGFALSDSKRCTTASTCLDMHRGNLKSITVGDYSVLGFDSGGVETNSEEYYGFDVKANETVELTLHHASDSVRFDFYHQTETSESLLEDHIESILATNPSTVEDTLYLQIEEDGRIIVKVSTSAPYAAYALQRTIHDAQLTMTVEDATSQFEQIGHGTSKSVFSLGPTGIVKIAPVIEDIAAQLALRVNDDWIIMPEIDVQRNMVERIYAYPNTTLAMLTIESSVHWVDITIESFADGNTSIDAPAYHPSSLETTNWPVLYSENTESFRGELTLPTMDVNDVYFISVDGWVDSEHRLHVFIRGMGDLRATVQELDQETMEILQERPLSPDIEGDMDIYITVGPGLHVLELHHADERVLENQTWSNDLPELEYEITITKVTTEIGEEPWFAPSDEAKFWGSTVRWILGIGMIIPALFLVYTMRKTKREGERLGAMKQRLKILTNLLDEGKESPKQTRKSLVRSLQAVATLPWQSAIASWGDPEHAYTTDGTSLAVWNLDPRLAKSLGNWPILVGLNTEHDTWEVAAFRFDAPYGQALTVDSVEPRLLHQGEEVFIDAIAKNTTVFLTVDLVGDATQVDVELNGQVEGVPRAMRIPFTLNRFAEEE